MRDNNDAADLLAALWILRPLWLPGLCISVPLTVAMIAAFG